MPSGVGAASERSMARAFSMLWSVTAHFRKPGDRNEPFGPLMTLAHASRSAIPSDFRDKGLEVLAYIADACEVIARFSVPAYRDTCWLLDRKRAALATNAISSYCEIVRLVDQKSLEFPYVDEGTDQTLTSTMLGTYCGERCKFQERSEYQKPQANHTG